MTDTDFSKATERPWKQHLVDSTAIVPASGGDLVAKVEGDYDTDWEEMEANAALIVAAVNAYDPEREKKVEALVDAADHAIQDMDRIGVEALSLDRLCQATVDLRTHDDERTASLKGGENG